MAHSILFCGTRRHLGPRPSQGARLIVKRCHGQLGKTYASVYVFDPLVERNRSPPTPTCSRSSRADRSSSCHPDSANPILVKPPVIASFSPDSNVVVTHHEMPPHHLDRGRRRHSTARCSMAPPLIGSTKPMPAAPGRSRRHLTDGNHSFTAEDVDAAGNVSAASGAVT